MTPAEAAALLFITVHSPDGSVLHINPIEVILLRPAPRERRGHYDEKVQCLINTVDGKSIPVIETCAQIQILIEQHQQSE